jgi:hypothetical protein
VTATEHKVSHLETSVGVKGKQDVECVEERDAAKEPQEQAEVCITCYAANRSSNFASVFMTTTMCIMCLNRLPTANTFTWSFATKACCLPICQE